MSEIEIPDWVVEVAARAYFEDMCSLDRWNDPMDEAEREDWRDGARKILTAALGAWVVHVGYENRWHSTGNKYLSRDPAHPDDGDSQRVYAMRQEKPK